MQLFYAPNIQDNNILDKSDSLHCIKVLRKQIGDTIHLIDGKGGFYKAIITDDNPKKCHFQITAQQLEYNKRKHHLHIAIAPTKNINRFEWFLEKATEIGIDEITPILTFHSERKKINHERLEKILISAMKQSLKAYLPQLNPLTKWKDFLKQTNASDTSDSQTDSAIDYKAIACMTEQSNHLFEDYKSGNASLLIGPEGGFSTKEIEQAQANGFAPVTLGNNRLRTETAGVVACQMIGLKGDLG